MGSDEETVLREAAELRRAGIIRRVGALMNYRALGMTATLVAAHVEEESLREVAEAVNALRGVSHNYQRKHYYNMWFTLQVSSEREIKLTLLKLSGRFGIDFHSLPVRRIFKLDVRFDAEGEGQVDEEVREAPKGERVELDDDEKRVLSELQGDLELVSEPFGGYELGLGEDDVLRTVQGLVDKGVVRRIAAVVDHRKLGFVANVLFAGKVAGEKVGGAGERLGRLGMVSHCYEREVFEGWPYNLFAMMHARSMGEIQHAINRFVEAEGIELFELLPTAAELKKQPVRHRFE
jgi:DNA-binding Lrp family transcriptional regulator